MLVKDHYSCMSKIGVLNFNIIFSNKLSRVFAKNGKLGSQIVLLFRIVN
jgi:hypothetical protein